MKMKLRTIIAMILCVLLALSTQNCNTGSAQSERSHLYKSIDSLTLPIDTTKKTIPAKLDSLTILKHKRDSIMKTIIETKSILKQQNKSLDSMLILKAKKRK